jgi:hypothetical protein
MTAVHSGFRLFGGDDLFEGSVATIEFAQEAISCAFADIFSLFIKSLHVRLGAGEENVTSVTMCRAELSL